VIAGAGRRQVQLLRQPDTTDADWALLGPLRFWLIAQGEKKHTLGFLAEELPKGYRAPFRRWVVSAIRRGGEWPVKRESPDGTVIRVHLAAETVRVLPEAEPLWDDLPFAELVTDDPEPVASEEPPGNPNPGDVFALRVRIDAPEHAPGELVSLRWKAVATLPDANG
jgi:hypothetical protein